MLNKIKLFIWLYGFRKCRHKQVSPRYYDNGMPIAGQYNCQNCGKRVEPIKWKVINET